MSRAVVAQVLLVVAACCVLLLRGPGSAPDAAERARRAAAETGLPVQAREVRWYGLYASDTKCGHARRVQEPVLRGGVLFIRAHDLMVMHIRKWGGAAKHVRTEQEILYTAESPYRVAGGWHEEQQDESTKRVVLSGVPPAFEAHITEGGRTRTWTLRHEPPTWYGVDELHAWFQAPRDVGDTLTCMKYELGSMAPDYRTVTVRAVERTEMDGVPATHYAADFRCRYSGRTGTLRFDSNGTLLSETTTGALELRLEPEHLAKQPGQVVDIHPALEATIDKPLGRPADVIELVVEVRGPGADVVRDGPRQRAHYDVNRKVLTLKLGAMHDPKVPADPGELVAARQETGWYPIRNVDVVALAKRAIGSAVTRREQVERLVAFVDEYVEDIYGADPLSVLDVIRLRKGDCSEHAALFTTLARAVGIPARSASGLMYSGRKRDGGYVFGGHAWNEVVIDGLWVPVDAAWGETEINATHIRLSGAPGYALSGAKFKQIAVRHKTR